jgi:selenide,water dikinase
MRWADAGFPRSQSLVSEAIRRFLRKLRGGLAKVETGTVIGGHSVRNEDVLFGYAVTGLIDPKRVLKNVGARTGDMLLYTKLLGTGVIATALKNDKAPADAVSAAIHSMSTLNRAAAEALPTLNRKMKFANAIHAVTDVTDSAGHAREMALGNPEEVKGYRSHSITRPVHLFTGPGQCQGRATWWFEK